MGLGVYPLCGVILASATSFQTIGILLIVWLIMYGRTGPLALPSSTGNMSKESSAASLGSFAPTTAAQVAKRHTSYAERLAQRRVGRGERQVERVAAQFMARREIQGEAAGEIGVPVAVAILVVGEILVVADGVEALRRLSASFTISLI